MKRKSAVITIIAFAVLAIMIALLAIENEGFAVKALCYVIPYFALLFAVYGLLLVMAKKHTWIQEKREKMLQKSKALKLLANVIPTFAAIWAALEIPDMTAVQCAIAGIILGAIYGFASYFTSENMV